MGKYVSLTGHNALRFNWTELINDTTQRLLTAQQHQSVLRL
jgi:hypothetical protein